MTRGLKTMRVKESEMAIPQNPLILRCHRLMEAFAKSDDERDFYFDRVEGAVLYVDLDKSAEELEELQRELIKNQENYIAFPKLTYYEIKKVMEGFVHEKVYDIDTKEKLLDIIQSKEARENFLEFIYDHHNEMEKWQQYYQERFRIRIIEWLRNYNLDFVFEEDLDLTKSIVEKVKMSMFDPKGVKEVLQARKMMALKAKTYYSNEALNPRPKRGRPPKQVAKVETEPQFSADIFLRLPKAVKPFLFLPDYRSTAAVYIFSGKFTSEADLLAHRKQQLQSSSNLDGQSLGQKLAVLRALSSAHESGSDEEIPSFLNGLDVAEQVEAGRKAVQKEIAAKQEKSVSYKANDKRDLGGESVKGGGHNQKRTASNSSEAPPAAKKAGLSSEEGRVLKKSSKEKKGRGVTTPKEKAKGAKKVVNKSAAAKASGKKSSASSTTPKTKAKARLRPLPQKKKRK